MYPVYSTKQNSRNYVKVIDDLSLASNSTVRNMYYVIPDHVEVLQDFFFDFEPQDETKSYLFLNGKTYDGIVLLPKNVLFDKSYNYSDPVCIDIQASVPLMYNAYKVFNFEDYAEAKEVSESQLIWIIHRDIQISKDFCFGMYIEQQNSYDNEISHVFSYEANGEIYTGGAVLTPVNAQINKDQFFHFNSENFKYHDSVVGTLSQQYDIIFISYDEINADDNYKKLLARFPDAKRVHGVKGIHEAHRSAAEIAQTDMFWVVDADAEIDDNFNFDYVVPFHNRDTVHVWRSKNPINQLVYGYGGVKLLPSQLTLNMNPSKIDMTTSISDSFKAIEQISNITAFNTDKFSAWRSAFRECAKLSSKTIKGQVDAETDERLEVWTTVGKDKPFGEYAILGAKAGKQYGKDNNSDISLINDFDWLYEQFSKHSLG